MRAPEPVVLEGRGVRLEPLTDAHVPDLLPVAQDDLVWRFLSVPQPRDAAALTAVVDDLGAQRVTFKLDARNTRSFRAVERLGAQYDGTLRHHRLRADGTVRDSAYFSVLAAEWPAVRAGLDARLARAAPEAPAR